MKAESYRPDDPEFARYIAGAAERVTLPDGDRPPPPFSPKFGDYVSGAAERPAEGEEEMVERATEDEVMTLPDGRQIQIQAKGAPVNEKLAERERELTQRSIEREESDDPLREIRPEGETRAIGTGVTDAAAKPLGGEAGVREAAPADLAKTETKVGAKKGR